MGLADSYLENSFPKSRWLTPHLGGPRFFSWDTSYLLVILIQTNKSGFDGALPLKQQCIPKLTPEA